MKYVLGPNLQVLHIPANHLLQSYTTINFAQNQYRSCVVPSGAPSEG